MRARPAAVLALAVVAYALAAWAVAPGFYDGIAPQQPYRWVSPPPPFAATNQPPQPGHATAKVGAAGTVDAGSASTQDGQAAVSFTLGTFTVPADRSPVTIDVTPQPAFPNPGAVKLATNVYCVAATSPLAAGKSALLTLQFSSQLSAPSDVYEYTGAGPWRKLGNAGSAAPYYIAARTSSLGCFAGGYVPSSSRSSSGSSQTLPIVVAIAVVVVLLATIPLVSLRRRGAAEPDDDE